MSDEDRIRLLEARLMVAEGDLEVAQHVLGRMSQVLALALDDGAGWREFAAEALEASTAVVMPPLDPLPGRPPGG